MHSLLPSLRLPLLPTLLALALCVCPAQASPGHGTFTGDPAGTPAGAAKQPAAGSLVQHRMTGSVTYSGVFADGTVVPVGARVEVQLSYDTTLSPADGLRQVDGSGWALYQVPAQHRMRLDTTGHSAAAQGFQVLLHNDLNQPFGDVFESVAQDGSWIDGLWQPGAQWTLSLMSQPGRFDALASLALPRRLVSTAFDAFKVGRLGAADASTLLMFDILRIKSSSCVPVEPGADVCAPPGP